jgi:hypothetical protein
MAQAPGQRYRDGLNLGACHARAGLDQAAKCHGFGRADCVEHARAVVSEQLYHQTGKVARVDDLNRLRRIAGHGHPAAALGAAHPTCRREPGSA